MKVQESFHIAEPPERLWEFFAQVDQVARCVPGVESVDVVDDDNTKIRVTQSVGPMTATFDLKMRITEREANERLVFTAVGRAVKGAAGNVRTTNVVRLTAIDEGTRVDLESDLAMGGVMGSLGQKVVAKQAGVVTKQFSASLERAITGESEPSGAETPPAVALDAGDASAGRTPIDGAGTSPASAGTEPVSDSTSRWRAAPALAAALAGLLIGLAILARGRGSR